MKKCLSWIIVGMLLISIMGFVGNVAKPAQATSPNLVVNPGFENGLTGWITSAGTAVYSVDSTTYHSGSYSCKGVETNTGSLGRLYQDVTGITSPGNQYQISAWIKTSNVIGTAVIALDYVGSGGWTPPDGYVMDWVGTGGTTGWTFYQSPVFTLPPMPSDCQALWFLFDFNNGAGTAWWDDVSLVSVSGSAQTGLVMIGSSTGGSVSYSCSAGSGVVSSGQSQAVNVAVGDDITFTSYPNSGFSFSGWTATSNVDTTPNGVPINTQSSTITVVVYGNGQITANFQPTATSSFQLQVSPQSQTVALTGDTYYDVLIEPLDGFSSSVTLKIDNTATLSQYGITVSAPSVLYPNVYYSIEVIANDNPQILRLLAESNSYVTRINITASSGGVNEPQSLTLTVTKMIGVKNEISISQLTIESSQGSSPHNLAHCFTLQQNFYVTPNGIDKSYWVQNVLIVGEDSSSPPNILAVAIYQIYSSTWVGGIYYFAAAQQLSGDFIQGDWIYAGDSVTSQTELTLTSSISSSGLLTLSSNWGSTGTCQLPQGSYIANLTSSLGRPQLDVVGPPSTAEVTGQTSFGQPTSGSVLSFVQLGLSGTTWYSSVSQTTVTANPTLAFTSPSQTGETSKNLAWTLTPGKDGDYYTFGFSSGSPDQGVSYTLGTMLSQETTVASLSGGSVSVNQVLGDAPTDLNVSISGSAAPDGTNVNIASSLLNGQPAGTGQVNLTPEGFFDVQVSGITDGTALISITNPAISTATPFMQYWNGSTWLNATGTTVLGDSISGALNVSALAGTPIVIGGQYNITFSQTGVGSDFTGTVLIVDGTPYNASQIPVSFIWAGGSVHTFAFQSPLIAEANAEQYVWTNTTGLSSLQSDSINVTTNGSIVGNYETAYVPPTANFTITINADGSISPSTAPVSNADNITYTFTGNIVSESILVQRDNIVLDGAGYAVQGTGASGSTGIDLSGRKNVTVNNAQIENFNDGILLNSSSSNTIAANRIINNSNGIYAISSYSSNSISGNNITANNENGIELDGSSNNSISGNNITANNGEGINLLGSDNIIIGNELAKNNGGICILDHSSDNKIYHNNFIDNPSQASSDQSINAWDSGYPQGGNYWSNYNGTDFFSGPYQNVTGSDGIGDTPYVIDANNTDNYPLRGMFSDFNATSQYHVQTISNSTISDFQFDGTAITFNAAGDNGTTGFCRIYVPTVLINGTITVFVNGTEVPYSLLPGSNSTNSYLYFTYHHSTQEVIITPEFPSFLILPLFLIAILLTDMIHKKRPRRTTARAFLKLLQRVRGEPVLLDAPLELGPPYLSILSLFSERYACRSCHCLYLFFSFGNRARPLLPR